MRSILIFLFLLFSLATAHADSINLGTIASVQQIPNQKGAVVISGNFVKPVTSDQVTLTVQYKDATSNWVPVWCKSFGAGDQYNENLKAVFELPASVNSTYDLKIELSAAAVLNNWSSISWQNNVNHYKQADYTYGSCDLDENQYTVLFTPKKTETLVYSNGNLSGVKDRVTSGHLARKLNNIVLSINGSGVLNNVGGTPCIGLSTSNSAGEVVSSQKYIYQGSEYSPFEYSYHDPVFLFAGKFPVTGFFIKFSNWYLPPEQNGETSGRGLLDFTDPNHLMNRYYNLFNTIDEQLHQVITDQEPVVIAISKITGLRIYKANGSYISLNATSNYNTHNAFGYPKLYEKFRGPGSENFSLKGVTAATFYGMGAIRNHVVNGQPRPLAEVETEIRKFINYVGIFGGASGNTVTGSCANPCIAINASAQPDYTPTNWTLAPNSYVFTGKDKNGNDVDGFYIPVAKAYAMWENGGRFMKNAQGSYTPIPAGTETAGLYWEDEHGLIKDIALEGSGKNARIKVMVNKRKEGNAVISYRVNGTIYWTWHAWVTDDPTSGSDYHHGFEKDKNGNLVNDWRWMDRNLGATNADFIGQDWHRSGGLQYQWGRKDPFPPLVYKNGSFYEITGEVGAIRHRNAVYTRSNGTVNSQSDKLPVKFRGNTYTDAANINNNTGFDAPNENIRYAVNNPIHYILPPVYLYKLGDTPNSNGENYFQQITEGVKKKWIRRDLTTWFSKQKYMEYHPDNADSNVAWDLWGDINGGSKTNINSNNAALKELSSRYALKSPYDPCPCNWRVPSNYATVNSAAKASPWGSHTGNESPTTFSPDSLAQHLPGIKIYPGLGFDFTNVSSRNIGKIPINGNYESYPNVVTLKDTTSSGHPAPFVMSQDHGSDGGLQTSTFSSGDNGSQPLYGTRNFEYISDPYNFGNHTRIGWYYIDVNAPYGNTGEAAGVRCIKDPNNAYMPAAFETEYVSATAQEYTMDTLKKWTKDANSYIADPATQNRVVSIPLRKAYAMQKLYLSGNGAFPSGSIRTPVVTWTTNTALISKMQIINGTYETDTLKVTLTNGQFGNVVVAFHLGNSGWMNGTLPDPVMWSWHIWAPTVDPRTDTLSYTTESIANNGIVAANQQFVNPTRSAGVPVGVPLTTTFMNMDLGALNPAPAVLDSVLVLNSGGLHYQWGRKDPIPVFLRPGGYWRTGMKTYTISRQVGINSSDSSVIYSAPDNENTYLQNFSREFTTYAAAANVSANDSKAERIRKVLKYATENPLTYLFHNADASTNSYNKVKDWLSDENNLFTDRWGHAAEKSPFDPCPAGWRIPDGFSAGSKQDNNFTKGINPWFYNGYQVSPFNDAQYGLSVSYPQYIFDETYNAANKRYPGKVVAILNFPATRFVWVFQDNKYRIGNLPNNGIRGVEAGNRLVVDTASGATRLRHSTTGLWLANLADTYSGKASHLRVEALTGSGQIGQLIPGAGASPQAAMSCRCAKIQYDATNHEISRYDPNAIAVLSSVGQRPGNVLDTREIKALVKENKITVFPNPVSDLLRINATDGRTYYYQVYSMAGQLVKAGKFVNKQTDLSALPVGAYLIRINSSESVVKIIKR